MIAEPAQRAAETGNGSGQGAPTPAVDLAGLCALAARLAADAKPGDVIALWGDLGAGKTTFARAFIEARAAACGAAVDEVPSPTFTLVQTYDLPTGEIWHFDLYRLSVPGEAWELGIEDAFAGGIALIEWPGRLGDLLPAARIDVDIAFADDPARRRVRIVRRPDQNPPGSNPASPNPPDSDRT